MSATPVSTASPSFMPTHATNFTSMLSAAVFHPSATVSDSINLSADVNSILSSLSSKPHTRTPPAALAQVAVSYNVYSSSHHTSPSKQSDLLRSYGSIAGVTGLILFDPGSTTTFVNPVMAVHAGLRTKLLEGTFAITLADGATTSHPHRVAYEVPIRIEGYATQLDMTVAPIGLYAAIIGKDWFDQLNPTINWPENSITIPLKKGRTATIHATSRPLAPDVEANVLDARSSAQELYMGAELLMVNVSKTGDAAYSIRTNDPAQRIAVELLLDEFADTIPTSPPADLPPFRPGFDHDISTPGVVLDPPYRPPIRLSQENLEELRRQLQELISSGRLRVSKSPYGAPVFFVRKADGTLRLVCDWRSLNSITVKNRVAIPRIQELLDQLRGARYFSKIDLAGAFHQVRVSEEDIPKTAITTPLGHFEWVVMSFGLVNAPATFTALMTKVLEPFLYKFALCYLDDILVYSRTFSDHLTHLRSVLSALRQSKLYAKPSKCEFVCSEVTYVGHRVSYNTISIDPDKAAAIAEWPTPASSEDLSSFLGLATWFSDHVPSFSEIASPLFELSGNRRQKDFVWTPECEKAFEKLRKILCSDPVLTMPDFSRPFFLACDSSLFSIGAVLLQRSRAKTDKYVAIAFMSAKLSATERRWPTQDRELYAVKRALAKFRPYVHSSTFEITVMSDHNPLTYFFSQAKLSDRQYRWLDALSEYKLRLVYVPGRENRVADALSRIATAKEEASADSEDLEPSHTISALTQEAQAEAAALVKPPGTQQLNVVSSSSQSPWLDRVRISTLTDSYLGPIMTQLVSAPIDHRLPYPASRYFCDDGLLFLRGSIPRLCIPDGDNLRSDILYDNHDAVLGGHRGGKATLSRLVGLFHWPGMKKFVTHYCSSCEKCQRSKKLKPASSLLQPSEIPSFPFESVAMDFMGGLTPSPRGNDSILVVICRLIRMVRIFPVKSTATAKEIATLFFNDFVKLHGIPISIISDRDPKFTSNFWAALMRLTGIRLAMTTANHPQADGLVEKSNDTITESLRASVNWEQSNWEELLPAVEFAINSSVTTSTGFAPFELYSGALPRTPSTVWASAPLSQPTRVKAAAEFLSEMRGNWAIARDSLLNSQKLMAKAADAGRALPVSFKAGDLVLVSQESLLSASERARPKRKLRAKRVGPYKVLSSPSPGCYEVDLPASIRAHRTINSKFLYPYIVNTIPGRTQPSPPAPIIGSHGEEELEVDEVRAAVFKKGKPMFLIHWTGTHDDDDTYEPLDCLVDDDGVVLAPLLVFLKKNPKFSPSADFLHSLTSPSRPIRASAPVPPAAEVRGGRVLRSTRAIQIVPPD